MNTTSEIIVSQDHIDPKHEDGFIIYKIGYVHPPRDGVREASMIWGNAKSGIQDAPANGKIYGRKDATYVEVSAEDHDHEIGNQVLLFENGLV